jgi:copper chaperone
MNTTVSITGMTCGHCVASVTEELEALDSVQSVAIDLKNGGTSTATIISAAGIDPERIREAIAEAGYAVADVDA